ncbi:MAG: hypothetical protein ACLFQJ_06560 [Campylobacterales bacterium]
MNEHIKSYDDFKIACGVDTLYFFIETIAEYIDLYKEIESEIQSKIAYFSEKKLTYENRDIMIQVGEYTLEYLGSAKGFIFLAESNDYFKVGFKHPHKQQNLHNIKVDLKSKAIYTLGLPTILENIKSSILGRCAKGFHISRADINCFINYDFSSFTSNDFVSRKRKWRNIKEDRGSSSKAQTIYIGNNPLKLRLYDKKAELKRDEHKELFMFEYFLLHGLSLHEPIWNVEFEVHREEFKSYSILTIDDFLSKIEMLFKTFTKDIRLAYVYRLSDSEIKNRHRNRAKSIEVWEYIHKNFTISLFQQSFDKLRKIRVAYEPRLIEEIYHAKLEEVYEWGKSKGISFA